MTRDKGDRLPIERRSDVLRLVRQRGAATVSEVVTETGVSASTVRRDLKALDEQGLVQLSHGGAAAVESTGTTFEPLFSERRRRNPTEKARIAEKALEFLEPSQSVIFDSSSTVLAVIEALQRRPVALSAVTNDVSAAAMLSEIDGVSVVLPGGQVREGSFTLLGSYTGEFFRRLHADVLLLGVHAISGGCMTDASLEVVEIKRAMIQGARKSVLLVDHEKFGAPAFFEVGETSLVDDLITGSGAPEEALEPIRSRAQTRIHLV